MKKHILFTLALAALLASCSKSKHSAPEEEARVRVELGTKLFDISASTTRAALTADNWGSTEIGVWGLSKNADDWSTATGYCLVENNKATIGSTGKVSLSEKHYYPLTNTNAYSFYTYHPYDEYAAISENKLVATYTLDGSQDIIYATAVSTNSNGYNAKYIREGGTAPELVFSHKLARLVFTAKDENTNTDTNVVLVKSIKVKGVKNKATLVVADKENPSNNGLLTFSSEATDVADLALKDSDGTTVTAYGVQKSVTTVGESIMVPPGETSFTIEVIVGIAGTIEQDITKEIPITRANEGIFAAGKTYKVNLSVYSSDAVSLSAILTDWEEGEEEFDSERIKLN